MFTSKGAIFIDIPRGRVEYLLVMCSVSTNGERAGLANSKLTIDSLLECS